jgi:hypothetical protein
MGVTTNLGPSAAAEELLETVWKEQGRLKLPVDPFVIANKLGIKTRVAALPEGVSGIFRMKPGMDPEIYVNADDSSNRQRFTCAHELGHYSRWQTLGEEIDREVVEHRDLLSSAGSIPSEVYANQFAAELLMPRAFVKDLSEVYSLVPLTYEFGVSADAMDFRLRNLGLKK